MRVELLAERRGSELRADVTAEAETVHVRVWQDGVEALDRAFRAPRRTEVDLLAEAIESGRRDPVAVEALRSAALVVGAAGIPRPRGRAGRPRVGLGGADGPPARRPAASAHRIGASAPARSDAGADAPAR